MRPSSRRLWLFALAAGIAIAAAVHFRPRAAQVPAAPPPAAAAIRGYEIVGEYPHDADAFTQGLLYRDGFLYESTGLSGRASLRKVPLETGEVLQRRRVDDRYFAEGLTDWGNVGRNTLRGPELFQVDLALQRRLRIGAARNVEFRLEAARQMQLMMRLNY